MTPERFEFNSKKDTRPIMAFKAMTIKEGMPISSLEIAEAVCHPDYSLGSVRTLVSTCRDYAKNQGNSIYSIFGTSNYVYMKTEPVGKWIHLPHQVKPEMRIMSDSDMELVHQYEVRGRNILFGRLTRTQSQLFSVLCDFSCRNEFEFISTGELATRIIGLSNESELNLVRWDIFALRNRIKCLNSISIETIAGRGYRIVKKSS